MSDEAEKHASEIVERLRVARAVVADLAAHFRDLGKRLNEFGYTLQRADRYVFDASEAGITVGNPSEKAAVAHVNRADLNWESILMDVRAYVAAKDDVRDMEAQLRAKGVID